MPLPRLLKSERRRVQLCRSCGSGVIRVDVRANISDMAHPDLIRALDATLFPASIVRGRKALLRRFFNKRSGLAIDIFCLCCQFEHSQKMTPVLPIGFLKGLRVLT